MTVPLTPAEQEHLQDLLQRYLDIQQWPDTPFRLRAARPDGGIVDVPAAHVVVVPVIEHKDAVYPFGPQEILRRMLLVVDCLQDEQGDMLATYAPGNGPELP